VAQEARTPADLDKVAAAHGLKAEESALFARGEAVGRLGVQPAINAQAFDLADGVMAGPVTVPGGRVVFHVSGRQDSHIPALDEVRARVRDDAVQVRALDLARKKAEQVAAVLKSAPDFQKAAKAEGFATTTSDLLTREAVIPGIGLNPDIDAVAFTLPVGGVSGAIPTAQGAAVIKVLERLGTAPADFAAARDAFRDQVLGERRTRFFSAYMERVRGRMRIEIDAEGLKRVLG
jgi:peptidyl-prolyl cis-trans isomerase D